MIKCAVCGYENKDDAQYCLNCGSPIQREKLSSALDDVSEEQTIMLNPGAMQARINEEMRKQRESSGSGEIKQPAQPISTPPPPASPPQAVVPPIPVTQPAPQPATGPTAPPAAARTPASGPMTPPPSSASGAPVGGSLASESFPGTSDKPFLVTFLLAFFLGWLGVHRFYVGKTGTGILMLVTLGACGIWQLVDVIMILMGKFQDAQGRDLAK